MADRHQVARHRTHERPGAEELHPWIVLHPAPEFLEPYHPFLRRVSGDQAGIDGADRGADHPVGFDPGLVQGLVDADLVGPERTAALQDQDDLPEFLRYVARASRTRRGD